MLKSETTTGKDRGATAVILAAAMFLLIGMAAIAIDVGAGFVERRADQTAADLGAIAGALEIPLGTSGGGVSDDDMVTSALDYVRQNLPTQYSDADWQALWEGCVDPASERNDGGFNFVAMSPPAAWGWTLSDSANWCVSQDSANSLFRVHTPDQVVATTFARVIGFNSLQTHAAAVASILPAGAGIRPFGFPVGAGDGAQHCLSAGPTGLAQDPCTGPTSGNFGTLKIKLFTPSPYNGCNAAPTNSVLALNIARGVDHDVLPLAGHDVSNEIRDICGNNNVNTLQSDPGFPSGTESGMATGSGLPAGETALLQQGPQMKTGVVGYPLDDVPLWNWLKSTFVSDPGPPVVSAPIDFGGRLTPFDTSDDAPLFCDPDGFTSGPYDFGGGLVPLYDFDGDGTDDALESWQHMQRCLEDYADGVLDPIGIPPTTGSGFRVIFLGSLGDRDGTDWSPRFTYVPQFWDTSLGPGISWLHILRYRAIFVQGTWWKRGNTWRVHHPGEACTPCTGNNYQLKQVSAFIIPDAALPADLRGDPPVGGFINPFTVLLYR